MNKCLVYHKAGQQSVHWTVGILRRFQAVFVACSWFKVARSRPALAGNTNRWAHKRISYEI